MTIESDDDLLGLEAARLAHRDALEVVTAGRRLRDIGRAVQRRAHHWTLSIPDGSLAAQYEHTIVVTRGNPLVLTA